MNNNTQEDYCSFEVCELLREKKFDVGCRYHYDTEFKDITWHTEYESLSNSEIVNGYGKLKYEMISAPTHAVAIKWIRENFEIEIDVRPTYHFNERAYQPYVDIKGDLNPLTGDMGGYLAFKKPEDATEAVLLHTLKHLI